MCNYFTFIQKLIINTLNNKWISTNTGAASPKANDPWN